MAQYGHPGVFRTGGVETAAAGEQGGDCPLISPDQQRQQHPHAPSLPLDNLPGEAYNGVRLAVKY